MKKFTFVVVAICIFSNAVCQDTESVEKEKNAILQVLLQEGKLFSEFDMEGITALHITDNTATRYDGSKVYSGWDEIKSLYESFIRANDENPVENDRNEKENVIIKVNGDNAWIICDNIWKWVDNGQSFSAMNKQIAVLEKIDGKWKFAFNAFVPIPEQ